MATKKMTKAEINAKAKELLAEKLGISTSDEGVQVESAEYAFLQEVDTGNGIVAIPVTVTLKAKKYENSGKFVAYDIDQAADEYQFKLEEKARKEQERKERKEKKIAQDKADREKRARERELKKAEMEKSKEE